MLKVIHSWASRQCPCGGLPSVTSRYYITPRGHWCKQQCCGVHKEESALMGVIYESFLNFRCRTYQQNALCKDRLNACSIDAGYRIDSIFCLGQKNSPLTHSCIKWSDSTCSFKTKNLLLVVISLFCSHCTGHDVLECWNVCNNTVVGKTNYEPSLLYPSW